VLAALIVLFALAGPASQVTASSPLVGKAAPPISGPSLMDGQAVPWSSFAGKWVLVNFAASWCVPCRAETPQLLQFQTGHAGAGDATVLEVEYDPADRANLRAFLQARGATWPAVDDGPALVSYGVGGIPESYLVDPAGTVIAKLIGGITAAQVDSLINQASNSRWPGHPAG
jgi:cytochrome c biogenesis protein CcmG/thiol:disulfide interchange protein DsbE